MRNVFENLLKQFTWRPGCSKLSLSYLRLRLRVSVKSSASTLANAVNVSGLLEAVTTIVLNNADVTLMS